MNRSLGLVLGFAADRVLADPARWHPVAGFGTLAAALERRTYADDRAHGAGHVALLVGGAAAVGALLPRGTLTTVVATWAVLGGTTLDREAAAVGAYLDVGDLPGARQQVARLVGRRTDDLDEAGVARAVIESVAENTSDAVVAPLVWGAVAGVPGLLAYRAANTLDAMVGHRSPRYERFGWAAARLDDVLNVPGARLTALLATLLGGDARASVRAWRRDAGGHPSPNAGPVEATFAGALGIRLGGTNDYAGRVEHRAVLGDGRAPAAHDVARARALARRVQVASLVTLLPLAPTVARRRRRRRG
ncbi:cobalamin biosynthesis protein [Nocardioides sp. C4-1]|uniref:cobalamin biosynthesis protein n=1 Tax=Nocardioides sp. C4-1 TaxID=3151851 RepID=UPI003263AD18